MARRDAIREEAAFQRKSNQGELCTPMLIMDSMKPVKSMGDGNVYDSKSRIRQHYKRDGFIEVGNEQPKGRFWDGKPKTDRDEQKQAVGKALARGKAAVDTMSDETIKRRQWERANKPL